MHSNPPKATELAQGWCALSRLHERIHMQVERALVAAHELTVREFSILNVLGRQKKEEKKPLQMSQLADTLVLSQSATTRLVARLEERGLLARCFCPEDRRGIYTHVTEQGFAVLDAARPTNDQALAEALAEAEADPELAPLVRALGALGGQIG